jgi:Thermolysin metallopeptidase, alpha-helical domain
MADYVDTSEDNGGVHLNSGIPNRAFALAARSIGGHSWERAGQVWYAALTSDQVSSSSDFAEFAEATFAAATRLFGDTDVPDRVRAAWVEVGVLPSAVPVDIVARRPPETGTGTPDARPAGDHSVPTIPTRDDDGSGGTGSREPTRTENVPHKVVVRRSGGFSGQVRSGEVELGDHDRGEELRRLLRLVDLQNVTATSAAPDRFVYTVEVDDQAVTLGEQDLPAELQRVVQIVLNSGSSQLPGTSGDLR